MSAPGILQPDGTRCYSGPTCKRHGLFNQSAAASAATFLEEARATFNSDRKANLLSQNELVKYPRTPHLPFSLGATSDDKVASPKTIEWLSSGIELVVTEKMDGGNYTMTRNHAFTRSIDGKSHLWDNPAKALWASVRHDILDGWCVSGESFYVSRSVSYGSLGGQFLVFGMWNKKNELLSWEETSEWSELMNLPTVPLLYKGTDFTSACSSWKKDHDDTKSEGFVVRNSNTFSYSDFSKNVAKWVRKDHVQTSDDFRHRDGFKTNELV